MYRLDETTKQSKTRNVCTVDLMNRFEYIKSVSGKSNQAMLAVLQDKPGDPDVLYLGQTDKPTLGDNDVLIKVRH